MPQPTIPIFTVRPPQSLIRKMSGRTSSSGVQSQYRRRIVKTMSPVSPSPTRELAAVVQQDHVQGQPRAEGDPLRDATLGRRALGRTRSGERALVRHSLATPR
jgi:hypothetical protein